MADLPDTMLALVQTGDGYSDMATGPTLENAADWLCLDTVPLPSPTDGEALIKVRRAAVNPSDVHFIKGEYGQPRIRGQVAGFEGCGDVISGPKHLLGQRVAFVAGPGAWAQYVAVDAQLCIPLHPAINDNDATGQIVNPLTAYAMMQMAKDAVIITAGASQLGKLMIAMARDMGVTTIATTRRDVALQADVVINTTAPDAMAQMQQAIATHKPRIMLDAVADQTSEAIFTAMPNRARWVCYGKLAIEAPQLTQMGQLIFMGKRIEGFWLTQWLRDTPVADQMAAIAQVQTRFADGRWKTDVAAELPLQDLIENLADALRKTDGKTIITMG